MKLPDLTRGELIKRYKRFMADIKLPSGETITAHCPNPGSMMGLKAEGLPAWISTSDNPKRKLKHTLELIEADGGLVGINTNSPNKLAEEAIRSSLIPELSDFSSLRREVKYGENSRIDILLEGESGERTFVEIKNCHLMREAGLAEFPDSVTSRGAKHLKELSDQVSAGARSVMLFIVQRTDCDQFDTAPDLDPTYHKALRSAADLGVEILIYDCNVSLDEISVRRAIPWRRS